MIGTQIGAYRILEKLGEGGMGAVYRARDTRLNRDVALKLLPPTLTSDLDRLARFRREAQVLAALNHPNIAQIYGLEDSGEAPVVVMEFVPGRTLDDVARSGPMTWDELVPIARQLAEALENAHERGIVHRDLKPANVKLRDDGTIKVLDFGLAKAFGFASDGSSQPGRSRTGEMAADSVPTITSPAALTGAGLILGTATYMAPEQAKGRAVDKRADIWAYGAVLFELITGQRLFTGDSVTETIAAVIKDDLKLDRLPPDLPPTIRALIERCLVRDPSQRLRDIGEARVLFSGPIALAEPGGLALQSQGAGPQPGGSAHVSRRGWLLPTAGAIALTIAAGFVGWSIKPAAPPPPLRRLDLAIPGRVVDFALSRDGSRLAYVSGGDLYVRRFDELDARKISRVHVTATLLAWSPDDRTIAFTAEATLRSVPADGGPILDICKIPASGRVMGLAWRRDDHLVFSVWRDSLYIVAAGGGTPAVHVAIDPANEVDFHHLSVLPDHRLVVATHKRKDDSDVIELITPGEARRVPLTDDRTVSKFEYLDPGRLVFRRTVTNPGVWAVPFDAGPIDVSRAALVQAGATDFRFSLDGTIVAFFPARVRESLVWIDEKGVETVVPGDALESPDRSVEISPDGRRAAYAVGTWSVTTGGATALNNATIVVRDLVSGIDTRLVGGPAASGMWEDTGSPTWSADGQRIVHRTGRVESQSLVERPAHVAGGARTLAQGFLGRLMPDGQTLIYSRDLRGTGVIEFGVIGPGGQVQSVRPLFSDDAQPNAREFDLSANGSLIAYVAIESNRRADVFLARTANPAERWLVQEGATRPRFSADGAFLFFARAAPDPQGSRQGEIVKVAIGHGPAMTLGRAVPVIRETIGGPWITSFDVAPDGRRLLMWKPLPPAPGEGDRYVLVQHALPR